MTEPEGTQEVPPLTLDTMVYWPDEFESSDWERKIWWRFGDLLRMDKKCVEWNEAMQRYEGEYP